MADLEAITHLLQRQRKDIDESLDDSDTRKVQTTQLLEKIEQLRRRVESTRQLFGEPPPNG